MKRIAHISDTHGHLNQISQNADLIVHSGDLLPDAPMKFDGRNRNEQSVEFQRNWLQENKDKIKDWIGEREFLYVAGNHDFLSAHEVANTLKSFGVNAIGLEDEAVVVQDVCFYGFPWVSTINSVAFWHQCSDNEMKMKIDKAKTAFASQQIEVLICHSPLFGVLDGVEQYGNSKLKHMIDHLDWHLKPNFILHGHIHEATGTALYKGAIVSNAATSENIIEL
jgi:Icc-related predicted phosphoesterase